MFYTLPEDRQKTDTLLQSIVSLGERPKKRDQKKKAPTKLKILHIYIHAHIRGDRERRERESHGNLPNIKKVRK